MSTHIPAHPAHTSAVADGLQLTVYHNGNSPTGFGYYPALAPFKRLEKTITQVRCGAGGASALSTRRGPVPQGRSSRRACWAIMLDSDYHMLIHLSWMAQLG